MTSDKQDVPRWITKLTPDLSGPTFVIGATLLLEQIAASDPQEFADVDGRSIREAPTAQAARRTASTIAAKYRPLVDRSADHSRVVSTCEGIIKAIDDNT